MNDLTFCEDKRRQSAFHQSIGKEGKHISIYFSHVCAFPNLGEKKQRGD